MVCRAFLAGLSGPTHRAVLRLAAGPGYVVNCVGPGIAGNSVVGCRLWAGYVGSRCRNMLGLIAWLATLVSGIGTVVA